MESSLLTVASLLILAAAQFNGVSANRTCSVVSCPEGCELETQIPQHRCAWCVCPPITATKTLQKFEERHCPKALMEHVKTVSQDLKSQIFQLSNDVRQQNAALKNVERLHRDAARHVRPRQCPTPMCDRNCTVVNGDSGCPECECPPNHCPRQTCPPGCRLESPTPSDRCPACACDEVQHGEVVASDSALPVMRDTLAERRSDDSSEESSEGDDGSVAPLVDQRQCATPMCARNCTIVTGDHGCPDCECPPTHCPRRRCPRFCHRETPPPADRCPECICEVTRRQPGRVSRSVFPPTRMRRHHHHQKRTNDSSEESSEESDEQGSRGSRSGQSTSSSSAVRARRDIRQGRRDNSSEESSEESDEQGSRGSRSGQSTSSSSAVRARRDIRQGRRDNSSEESSEESDEQGSRGSRSGQATSSSSAVRARRDIRQGRRDNSSEESSEEDTTAVRVDPRNCATPLCDRNCTIVTGDNGCPDCECPPTHCPRQRCPGNCRRESPAPTDRCPECVCEGDSGSDGGPGVLLTAIIRSTREVRERHRSRRDDDSSEESSEEDRGKGGSARRETSRDSSEESREDILRVVRQKRHHHLGGGDYSHQGPRNHTRNGTQTTQNGFPGGAVQCVMPNCEQHCTTKPGTHGCPVCDCPDICPDIVCGSGCHPDYTEAHRCERCICNPHIERQTVNDVFNAHCGEGNLRTLLIEFVNLKKTLDVLEQQLSEHDREIRRIETLHGTTGHTIANTTSESTLSTG